MKGEDVVVLVVALIGLGAITSVASCSIGEHTMRMQAIENGVAEWRCDSQSGKKEFVWLPLQEKGEK